jgi:hypothetical protein
MGEFFQKVRILIPTNATNEIKSFITVEYFILAKVSISNKMITFDEFFIDVFIEASNVETLIFYREELFFSLFNNSFNSGKF